MFNEILTGKATLDPQPVSHSPYRTESVPEVTWTCVDCVASYQASVGTPRGRCGPCHLAMASRNQAASNAALQASLAAIDARRRSHRWLRWALGAVLACVLAFIRMEARKDLAASQPRESAIYVSDPYVDQIQSYAREMCACADAVCASTVRAKWMNWQRYAIEPTDSDVLAAASDATSALVDCFNRPR